MIHENKGKKKRAVTFACSNVWKVVKQCSISTDAYKTCLSYLLSRALSKHLSILLITYNDKLASRPTQSDMFISHLTSTKLTPSYRDCTLISNFQIQQKIMKWMQGYQVAAEKWQKLKPFPKGRSSLIISAMNNRPGSDCHRTIGGGGWESTQASSSR